MLYKNKETHPVSFSDQLVLFRFFLYLFGKDSIRSFSELNREEFEGYDENQNTKFYIWLKSFCPKCTISADSLRLYDENICRYIRKIGEKRQGGIKLKYFQYFSLLFTEIFLDRYFGSRAEFVNDLNAYLQTIGMADLTPFTEKKLNKLAFMCATGSGKTLIMHANILQFLHYFERAKRNNSKLAINKIIVLAPNENMATQHLTELSLSSISAGPFNKNDTLETHNKDVIVIDMNKLREEGKDKTVSVDQFEQNNLLLVDEGHRGMSGDVWYDYRTRLAAEGFSFEYSATFKQALNSGSAKEKKDLIEEYGKSIIMDYSYKYFYEDGYGKDYRIYNLKEGIDEEIRQTYLTGCLVSFYQQMKVYLYGKADWISYQIEKPLLVYVGNRVTTSTSAAELTDVEEVILFLDTFLRNKKQSIERIRVLFNDDTGLVDDTGNAHFMNVFYPLKKVWGTSSLPDPEAVYMDILKLVFNTQTTADEPRLCLVNLKQVSGEIALKVGSEGEYFGVISIGDTAKLTKLSEGKGIAVRSDEFISDSFFLSIHEKKSAINVLIGSRKFTEGWNSWRVSTMGLINFAKGEGSQAIQLFGRGVRLHGYNGCLKRSRNADPTLLPVLETLTIFGIKAQYMEDFKKYLQDEGAPNNDNIFEFHLPIIKRYDDLKGKKLHVLRVAPGKDFKKQAKRLILDVPDNGLMHYLTRSRIVIDCRAKVQTIESEETSNQGITALFEERVIPSELLDYLDYRRIFEELELYKGEKYYYNISIDSSRFKAILQTEGLYALLIPENHLKVDRMEKMFALTEYCILILKNYLDRFFKYHKEKWESPFMIYQELTQDDANFEDEYKITCTSKNSEDPTTVELEKFLQKLEILLNEKKCIPEYEQDFKQRLFAFDFRNHLYAPLICVKGDGLQIQVSPVALNKDEKRFVDKLKTYTVDHVTELEGKSLYLLRNKSKTGLGFFEADNFYPDYILWLDTPAKQYISFIDPKGLTRVPWDSPKIMFYQKIKERQKQMIPPAGKEIILNSFIMSGTSPAMLESWWPGTDEKKWLERNVLCLDHEDCVENMFKKIMQQSQ